MSVQRGGYHQTLLHESPVPARAQRREGYNVDLFDDHPSRSPPTQPLSPPPPYDAGLPDDRGSRPLFTQLLLPPPTDTNVENNSQGWFPPSAFPYSPEPTQPFWQTRKGLIIISVIVILVVGGVIGGAVGGTVENNHLPSSNLTSSSTSSSGNSTSSSKTATDPGITPQTTSSSSFIPVATSSASEPVGTNNGFAAIPLPRGS